MAGMGTHSKPVNGVVTNGHAPLLAPFMIPPELQVRPTGPVASWPQSRHDNGDIPGNAARWRHFAAEHRGWLAAIPVILVNAVAVIAQLAFLRAHMSWAPAGKALVAVTLESVAVYLAWQAHLAIVADDSAMRLRLAAYGFAAIVGVMNYSHYMAPGWRPTFPALVFALCSVMSPWLWSIHSRRESRDTLKARGLIEPHAVRLGATRWMWHPIRSARVMFRATWQGENDPAAAIALPAMKASNSPVTTTDDAPDGDSDSDIDDDSDTPPPPPDDDTGTPPDDDKKGDTPPPPPPPPDPPKDRRKPPTGRDKALAIMKRNPGLPDVDVAKRAGVSLRTVQRARAPKGQDAEETS